MRIALVNYFAETEKFWRDVLDGWKTTLEARGHVADAGHSLDRLPAPISQYDIAITHAGLADNQALAREVIARGSFRWFINSRFANYHTNLDALRSSQVRYGEMPTHTTDPLVMIVEREWR